MTFYDILSSRGIYDVYDICDQPENKDCDRFENMWCTIYFVEPLCATFLSAANAQSEEKQRPVLELKDFLKLVSVLLS